MFIVVAYDIEDDKLRTRLHKTLRRFGEPVQYSVFECQLTENRLTILIYQLNALIKVRHDRVHVYRLCEACPELGDPVESSSPRLEAEVFIF